MKRQFVILLSLLLFSVVSHSQSFQKTDLGIKAKVNSLDVEIQLYGPSLVRVVKSPEGKPLKKESLSVTKNPQKTAFAVKQEGDVVSVKTEKIKVNLNTQSGIISFVNTDNAIVIAEKAPGMLTDFDDAGNKTYTVNQAFALDKSEAIYGLGQQQQGKMSQRNVRLNMVQGNTDDYVPFFVSTKGYGLFWDNYSPTVFEDNPDGTSFTSEVGDCIDYYLMIGDNIDGAIAGMRDLTGQVPMFPLWTYGFWQSKER